MIDPDLHAGAPGGFWRRALALVVDLAVFVLVQFSFGYVAGRIWGAGIDDVPEFHVTVVLFTLLFTAVYTTALHAHGGQTIGKALAGVRVMDVQGRPLPAGAALLRYLAYYVSVGTLGFGYLMAALRADRRALHDLIAGSRVTRV